MLTVCLVAVLCVLFSSSFLPGQALFANDGPLGHLKSRPNALPGALYGIWTDLVWLGLDGGSFTPNVHGLLMLLGPLGYINFSAPLSLLILGLSAWCFFRQLRFRPMVCILGGLAAALNMNFFSCACWGLPSRAVAAAMIFLALAALISSASKHSWIKIILAGLAVGIAVSEAADNGAIFSLYVAAAVLFHAWISEGSPAKKLALGVSRLALVALFAFLLAFQFVILLIKTQIVDVAGMQQDQPAKEERWDWATQWSVPKVETLRVVIPGLFGYRMDTPDGGQYWGKVGRQPGYEKHGQGFPRYSGSGEYAGVLVVLIALWGIAQSFMRTGNVFSATERKWIWFWSGAVLISVLLSFGRHAPFYRIIYALPYFSAIRNPMKFMHPFHLGLIILFAYGLQGLSRRYLENVNAKTASLLRQFKAWWGAAKGFEKKWTWGMFGVLGLSILSYLLYANSRPVLERYLTTNGFGPADAALSSRFSLGEVGWFVFFLALSVALVTCIQSGVFAGRRAKWAGVLIGLVLVVDLARANGPWIKYYNYREKYASNPVLDVLRHKPYEQRVVMPPFRVNEQLDFFQQLFQSEWLQHHFQYYNIQSLNMAQEPRMPADKTAYLTTLTTNIARYWQLTNTRYVLGLAGQFVDLLNRQLDPAQKRFKVHTLFTFSQSPEGNSILVHTNQTGPFALLEFTGALPRVKLYSQWQTMTNDQAALAQLASPAFDPAQMVVVSTNIPPSAPDTSTNQAAGTVAFTNYEPRRIELRADAGTPSVLLLNDKYDPKWKVRVDGHLQPLLRCNYIMRGVYLPAGSHTVVFSFEPPQRDMFVSLAALLLGLVLCGFLFISRKKQEPPTASINIKPTPKTAH